MVLADGAYMGEDAVRFWHEQLRGPVPDDLATWLRQRVAEMQVLWRDVARMNRSRTMWTELTERLEARDPKCAWTRHYDGLYADSQVMLLARTVTAASRPGHVCLNRVLTSIAERPEILSPITTYRHLSSVVDPAEPIADRERLKKLVRPLMPMRDRAIAHTELNVRVSLSWNQIDEAVSGVTDVFSHYSQRLTGVNYQVDFERPPWSNWRSVFSESLFPSEPS
jgi:hypothetical protein